MLSQNSLRQLSTSYGKLGKLQEQLATGKKISRPSDDPVVAMKGMYYRTNLTELEQYKRNLSESYAWMENSEAALDHVQSVMHRARELMVQGSNGTLSPEDRQSIAKEIEQLKEDFVQVSNTQVAGRYIFNGTAIDRPRITDANDPASVSTENSPFLEPSSVIIFKKTTKRRYTIVKKSDDQEQIRWAGIYGKMLYN